MKIIKSKQHVYNGGDIMELGGDDDVYMIFNMEMEKYLHVDVVAGVMTLDWNEETILAYVFNEEVVIGLGRAHRGENLDYMDDLIAGDIRETNRLIEESCGYQYIYIVPLGYMNNNEGEFPGAYTITEIG